MIDWPDAEEWLAEAHEHGWSVSFMKQQRTESGGCDNSGTPDATCDSDGGHSSAKEPVSIPHSDTVAVPDAAPQSKQESKTATKAEGTGCESLPTEPESPQAKLLMDQADSMARHTIPGIIEAGKSLDEFLVQRGRTGVDIEKVKSLSQELTGIFQRAKGEISRCR